jgi:protein suppressor of PHYA-105 1
LHYVRNAPFYQEMPVVMMSSNEHADVVLNCIRLVGLCTLNQVDP